jgi:diketogulonate reductase-like aldo/keto reductase
MQADPTVNISLPKMATTAILEKARVVSAPHLSRALQPSIPLFLYGTAWKKEGTADLVKTAAGCGFTAFDTANQPKHYREDLVGEGLRQAAQEYGLRRDSVYIQTKYTAVAGQDPNNIPYDADSSVSEQVRASVESSLMNLRWLENASIDSSEQSYIDTLVLHSPLPTIDETMEAWTTLEGFVPNSIRNLGVSNCNLFTLMDICERATIKPAVVQNRFYSSTRFDIGLRKFCKETGIIYQSFWTLTANPDLLRASHIVQVAMDVSISPEAALYCLVLGLGNTVLLNGTKSTQHMKDDLKAVDLARSFALQNPQKWNAYLTKFRSLIGESVL